jgi:ribosome maturation factor RimP
MEDVDLEVSSPGAERPLRGLDDYRRVVGRRVNVRYRTDQSERVVEGTLSRVSDESLTVADGEGRPHEVSLEMIIEARLAVSFGQTDRGARRRRE